MAYLPHHHKQKSAEASRRYYNKTQRPKRDAARRLKALKWCSAEVSEFDLAWAAGHFEGEGTVTILKGGRANNFRPVVCLDSTDPEVIAFFRSRWPCTEHRERKPSGCANAKPVYRWGVSSAIRVNHFLHQLIPHLRTNRVREKSILVQDFCSHLLTEQYNRASDKTWKAPIVARVRELNWRGTGKMPPLLSFNG